MVIRVQTKRPVFKPSPYETSRRSKGLPGWLILLLLGILLGAGGLLLIQTSYGPKQLSISESQKLISELAVLHADKQRLQGESDEAKRLLETERSENTSTQTTLRTDLKKAQDELVLLNEQLTGFIKTLPFDQRYGSVGISTANFTQTKPGGKLSYLVWVMQDKADRPEFNGQLELAIEGSHANGRTETITLPALSLKFGHYQYVSGSSEMPEGFVARRVNAKVLDASGKKQLTWRIMSVQQK